MFVDQVNISVKAGDGGNGAVSFRHEKFVDKGGPDGGNGGRGGSIIIETSDNESTLAAFRFQKQIIAENGKNGSKRKRQGRNGTDELIKVPVGTVVYDNDNNVIADLDSLSSRVVVAQGGAGGYGNAHFTSSTRQAPRVAEKGEPGDELTLALVLKMIANVGLVGLPNAGKSTFLSIISNAKPQIADYPFTTLTPNLGVVDVDGTALLFADIPGLIEGASKGKGLGDDFLRHVERTKVLVHIVDAYQEDVAKAYTTIQNELQSYKIDMTKRPQIVALSKIDGVDKNKIKEQLEILKSIVPKDTPLMAVSSKSKLGIKKLLREIKSKVLIVKQEQDLEKQINISELPVLKINTEDSWNISRNKEGFRVKGRKIEKFAIRTDFDNYHSVARLRDIMKKMGIMHGLIRQGIEPGQKILIGDNKIEY